MVSIDDNGPLPVRGVVVYIALGDEPETVAWHAYKLGQRISADTGRAEQFFTHVDATDDDPLRRA